MFNGQIYPTGLRKTFSIFYRSYYVLISKYNVGLKTLLGEGLSEPEFYGDLVYKEPLTLSCKICPVFESPKTMF